MTTASLHHQRRGFTLTELMIAVALLVVVIVASAKIFGIASQITAQGQATADVMQEAAALQQQLRADIQKVDRQGFFAIRQVAVANDINGAILLNPNLPPGAVIRADQLVFMRKGRAGTQVFGDDSGTRRFQEATAARVYYGHGLQLPLAEGLAQNNSPWVPAATFNNGDALFPWSADPNPPSLAMSNALAGTVPVVGTQPPAREWVLARQAVLLADDGGDPLVFLSFFSGQNATLSIWDTDIRNGLYDICATQVNDIRTAITFDNGMPRPWRDSSYGSTDGFGDQRGAISQAVFYPRCERSAPSMRRFDHALTTNVIGTACSSFRVEWTYNLTPDWGPPVWFGIQDGTNGAQPLFVWTDDTQPYVEVPFDPLDVEGDGLVVDTTFLRVYEALFGYDSDVTPWPDAIRVTATLHDTRSKLENGREFQFILDLPRERSN